MARSEMLSGDVALSHRRSVYAKRPVLRRRMGQKSDWIASLDLQAMDFTRVNLVGPGSKFQNFKKTSFGYSADGECHVGNISRCGKQPKWNDTQLSKAERVPSRQRFALNSYRCFAIQYQLLKCSDNNLSRSY